MQLEKKVENSMQNREFSIEESYHIFVFFLMEFWWNFLKDIMFEKGLITKGLTSKEIEIASDKDKRKDALYEANQIKQQFFCKI